MDEWPRLCRLRNGPRIARRGNLDLKASRLTRRFALGSVAASIGPVKRGVVLGHVVAFECMQ
jgi:hypothetical protein